MAKFGLFLGIVSLGIVGVVWLLTPPARLHSRQKIDLPETDLVGMSTVVQQVDRAFAEEWTKAGVNPADSVEPLQWARRLSLGLAGTIPSLEEIREFENQTAKDREQWWINHLLSDKRTADHLAERFARAMVGVEDGPFVLFRRRRFVSWLSDEIASNRPYSDIARSAIEGSGIWTASPAANFTTVTTDIDSTGQPDPIRLTARTSRAFLGLRTDCLQCHDDFLGSITLGPADRPTSGTQIDFHKLAAYFGDVRNSLAGVRDVENSEPYEYKLLDDDEATKIDPAVPYSPELLGAAGPLRARLADWVTHPQNRQFSRAAVNRVWAALFGRPLVSPIDDIPLHQPVPPALDILAQDFATHGFDLHRLIRVIAQTDAYHRGSAQPDIETDMASDSEASSLNQIASNWAAFPIERLRPEQVASSLIQSTSMTTLDSTAHIVLRLAGFGQQNDFVNRYGDFGENEFTPRGETVTQRLLLMNGQLLRERVEENGLGSPVRLASFSPTPEIAVEVIYLVTLTRRPDPEELSHFANSLRIHWRSDRVSAVRDLYWSMLNSAEFSWGH